MSNIDEELMDTIHKWSVQMRGKIASGDIAEKGIIHSFLERERILKIIDISENISQRKLAQIISISPQSISETLTKLENDGYITRTKNQNDKRETLIFLTENGRQRLKEIDKMRKQQTLHFLSPLNNAEKETLLILLKKLIKHRKE